MFCNSMRGATISMMSSGVPRLGTAQSLRIISRKTQQTRWNSTSEKPISPHVGFYKTNSRPVIKVILMAAFVYQVAYWGWVKLEKDEIKAQKNEIKELEVELQKLIKMAEEAGIRTKS